MWNLWKTQSTVRGAGLAMAAVLGLTLPVLAPSPAAAGNNIVVGTLSLAPNFNTVNFRLNYTGDDDQDATVTVRYWKTSASDLKDDGVVPMRWHPGIGTRYFAGKLFWLTEGVDYTIELVIFDPDGGGTSITQSVTTRVAAGHEATGPQIWVSPSGNDANTGFVQTAPKKTIASALAVVNTGSYPGAQIRLLPGVYYEGNEVTQSGTAANPYSIVGYGDPDTVIIAGNDPTMDHLTWEQLSPGSPIYRTRFLYDPPPPIGLVVAGWGQRLHKKLSLNELIDPNSYHPPYGSPVPMPQQGWYFDADYWLNVRLEGGADPNFTTMHISTKPQGLWFKADYWRAESLTVRYFGMLNDAGDAIALGTYNTPVHDITIRNCKFWTNAGRGVFGNRGSSDALVESCNFEDGRIGSWHYWAGKTRVEEGCVGFEVNGKGWACRSNAVRGTFNGVEVMGDTVNVEYGAMSDFHDNALTRITDDGFEFDCSKGQNLAVWNNFIQTKSNGISLVPTYEGPVYVMYNVFARCAEGAHKQGWGGCVDPIELTPASDATGYFYHNTVFIDGSTPDAATYNTREIHKNRRYLNNIMMGSTNFPVVSDHAGGGVASTCAFDYDLAWRQSGALWKWGGAYYQTLANVQSAFGWELHGVNQQPLFVDAAHDDFHPTASSPSVDMGTCIRGINTPYKTRPDCKRLYCNNPDAGAFEYGTCTSGCDLTPPSASPYLNVTDGCEDIHVSWQATGDDGNTGTATAYDLRWSTSPITTDAQFDNASPVPGTLPTPGPPGTPESFSIHLGNCGPHKYFALKIKDDFDNLSSLTSDPYGSQPACVQPPEMCWE